MCAKTVLMNFLMQIVEGSLTQCKYGRVMHVLGMSFLDAVQARRSVDHATREDVRWISR